MNRYIIPFSNTFYNIHLGFFFHCQSNKALNWGDYLQEQPLKISPAWFEMYLYVSVEFFQGNSPVTWFYFLFICWSADGGHTDREVLMVIWESTR